MSQHTVTLQSGQKMPLVGFGLWKVTNATCADTVYNAIKTGYRLFDGAADYGNEKEAGQGIQRAIKEGLVKREDLFITSKLWNSYHAPEHVDLLCKKQLADYGIQYFDLFLIHFPIALQYVDINERYPSGWTADGKKVVQANIPLAQTWSAMEKLVDQGLAKNIGVSNFQGSLVIDLMRSARIAPSVLQVEHHPYLQQKELIKFAKQNNIAVTAYSSFGPQSFIELDFVNAKDAIRLFEHEVITKIAKEQKRQPSQILLRWATQRGIAVVPKSNNQGRLEENLHCCDFDLTEEQMKSFDQLERGLRFNDPGAYLDPPIYIFA